MLQKFLNAIEDGRIFSATFQKKDGTIRIINCRLKVKKGITGKGLKFSPSEKSLIVVYDMHKQDYRMINLKTLLLAQVNGQIYKFI